jgi:hypothetical protein
MTEKQLRTAAVEGFKESLQLANDLVVGIIRAPVMIVSSFVHHDDRSPAAQTTSQQEKRKSEPAIR